MNKRKKNEKVTNWLENLSKEIAKHTNDKDVFAIKGIENPAFAEMVRNLWDRLAKEIKDITDEEKKQADIVRKRISERETHLISIGDLKVLVSENLNSRGAQGKTNDILGIRKELEKICPKFADQSKTTEKLLSIKEELERICPKKRYNFIDDMKQDLANAMGLPLEYVDPSDAPLFPPLQEFVDKKIIKALDAKRVKRTFVLREKAGDRDIIIVIRAEHDADRPATVNIAVSNAETNGRGIRDDISETNIATAYIKFDGCSHWYFKGEDALINDEAENNDSYYHLCGFDCYHNMILGMLFGWKVAEKVIGDGFMKLDSYMAPQMKIYEHLLDLYIIEEVTDGHIPEEPIASVNY